MAIWLGLVGVGFVGLQLWARLSGPPDDLGPGTALRGVQETNGATDSYSYPDLAALEAGRVRLGEAVASQPHTRVVTDDGDYLHALARTLVFGFPDDIELLVDRESLRIDIQAQARLGRSDFGVNRKRLAAIRASYESASK